MPSLQEFKAVWPMDAREYLYRADPSKCVEILGYHEGTEKTYKVMLGVEVKHNDEWKRSIDIALMIDPNIFGGGKIWIKFSYYLYYTLGEKGEITMEKSYLSKLDKRILKNAKKAGASINEILND